MTKTLLKNGPSSIPRCHGSPVKIHKQHRRPESTESSGRNTLPPEGVIHQLQPEQAPVELQRSVTATRTAGDRQRHMECTVIYVGEMEAKLFCV